MASDGLEDALRSLGITRTGDDCADLLAAARESMRRREQNSRDGGAVIAALIEFGVSYRDIEREAGIPIATAHRWAAPPRSVDRPDS